MAALFFLLGLAYLLASIGLGIYGLLGLCIRPLARTQSFMAGQIILIALLVISAVGVIGLCGFSAIVQLGWRELRSLHVTKETLVFFLATFLPFGLCWPAACRRPVVVFGVACVCIGCMAWMVIGALAGA